MKGSPEVGAPAAGFQLEGAIFIFRRQTGNCALGTCMNSFHGWVVFLWAVSNLAGSEEEENIVLSWGSVPPLTRSVWPGLDSQDRETIT